MAAKVPNFNFLKNNTSLLDGVQVGSKIKVTFDIRGREYNGRVFNDLVCFRLEQIDADGTARVPAAQAPASETVPPVAPVSDQFDDEMPF